MALLPMETSSCFLHSPIHSSASFSLSSYQSIFLYSYRRNASSKRGKNRILMATGMGHEDQNDTVLIQRRTVLFTCISILPLLKLRESAAQGLLTEDSSVVKREQGQIAEQALQENAPSKSNPLFSILGGVGVFASGILGALYALSRKEKTASEAIIDSMKRKLQENEASIISLQRKYETDIQKQKEEGNKQLKKADEERQSLMSQLKSVNDTITGLGKELQKEKNISKELKLQIVTLETNGTKGKEDKKKLEETLKEKLNSIEVLEGKIGLLNLEINDKESSMKELESSIAAKDLELKDLNSAYKQTQAESSGLQSDIKVLQDKFVKTEKELKLKNASVSDLNSQVRSLLVESDNSIKKLVEIGKEYDEFKASSEKKLAYEAQLLKQKEDELQKLQERLQLAQNEVSKKDLLISNLTKEKNDLKKVVEIESKKVSTLENELSLMNVCLERTRSDCLDLQNELLNSKNEANQNIEILTNESNSTKESLKTANEELKIACNQLENATKERNSLHKELVEVYKKVESGVHNLKEEKKIVISLNKQIEDLESQILKNQLARKNLEIDLEESTRSLDEMNKNALELSSDLKIANDRISSLEDEKQALYDSVEEQKEVSREARENLEDTHSLVMRLGKDKESLVAIVKKLEDELGAAKGEILRIRSQISISNNNNNSNNTVKKKEEDENENGDNVAVSVKKIRRKRKSVSQPESS